MHQFPRALNVCLLTATLWVSSSQVEASSAYRVPRFGLDGAIDSPGPATLAPDLASLRTEVLRLIDGPGWTNSEWGVLAVSLERGDTLLALDPDQPLAPASNQKLFTSAAALHHLGPEYRFSTFLLTDGETHGGVLEGDLILYGTGDPAISDQLLDSNTAVWEDFARTLREAGVHTVSGDVIGDASLFKGPSRSPSWSSRYLDDWYAAPVSALTFAENVVTLFIRGGAPGAPARIRLMPEGAELPLINTSRTVPGDARRSLFMVRDDPDSAVEIQGQIGTGAGELSRVLTVSDPSNYAASVFRSVLEAEGIDVTGSTSQIRAGDISPVTRNDIVAPAFRDADTQRLRTLAVHHSPPLRELIQILNKKSHNLYGEILLFTLGRITDGDASFRGGSEALTNYLTGVVGIPEEEIRIEDGSGLSSLNRATPSAFVRLLSHVATSDYAEPFWASLPEAGNRRELRRMYQTPAAGNLKAKTGTINRVSALSGIVRTADGEPIVFSILSNNVPSSWRAKRIEDGIGIELASFARPQAIVGD